MKRISHIKNMDWPLTSVSSTKTARKWTFSSAHASQVRGFAMPAQVLVLNGHEVRSTI